MPRYIDADALLEDIEQTVRFSCRDGVPSAEMRGANKIIDRIKAAPTISPDDVRGVGKWVEEYLDYKCSACGETVKDEIFYMFYPYQLPKFCPNCGARMKGGVD